MAYIFMDESGDLGFNFENYRTSKFFIITCLIVEDERIPYLIMKKYFKRLKGKKIKIRDCFFHAYKESKQNIKRFLELFCNENIGIISIILNKDHFYSKIKQDKHDLYNWLTNKLLGVNVDILRKYKKLYFIASRRETNAYLNQKFLDYLKGIYDSSLDIDFQIKHPQEKGLQLVDGISFAFYQKYEYQNKEFYDIISEHIINETIILK